MAENRINVQKYAMHFGTYMGVFWIAKFFLFPLGLTHPFLLFLFIGLTLGVPFMGYYYTRMFRDKACGGKIKFMQAWVFMVFMYMFAAILTAAAHYIYFRFIDNGYIINTYALMLEGLSTPEVSGLNFAGLDNYISQLKEMLEVVRSMTAIEITMQLLSHNIINCSILALIMAPFAARKKKAVS